MNMGKCSLPASIWSILLVWALSGSIGQAYPPDNAAVLYYKTCLVYQKPGADLERELRDVARGQAAPNQAMQAYMDAQVHSIKTLTDAANIEACDWGYDYSRGLQLVMAPLGDMRALARILMADAAIHIDAGDWRTGLDRCSTAYGMARHVKMDSVLICHLVGIAIEDVANAMVTRILVETTIDKDGLHQIGNLLEQVAMDNPKMQACLAQEALMVAQYGSGSELQSVLDASGGFDMTTALPDQESFGQAMDYYKKKMKSLTEAFDLDYVKAIRAMEALEEQTAADARHLSAAKVTRALVPAVAKCHSLEIRGRTAINALRAAVGIYLTKADQGRLPHQLPPDLPRDAFSGQDFIYQVTDAGFLLRCRGRDLAADKVHEYLYQADK